MLIINRFAPILSALALFLLGEIFIFYPQSLFVIIILSVILIFLSLWQLTGRQIKNSQLWNFLIAPFFLFEGWIFLAVFLEERWVKHLFLVIIVFFLLIFLHNLFLFLYRPLYYRAYSLENISNYLDLLAIWLWYSSFFGLIIFLGLSPGLFVLPIIIISALIYYQSIWVNKIEIKNHWPYLIIVNLLLAEVFLAVSFLPTNFYVNGLILTVVYYVLSGLSRNFILKKLNKIIIARHLLFGIFILILGLLTAKWQ